MRKFFLTLATLLLVATATAQLNVGSVNVRFITPKDYEHNNGWEQRREVLCNIIRFENFDIFGAQEVTHPQLTDMLRLLPDYDHIGVARDDGKQRGEYSPVFYNRERFVKLDGGTFWLSETPDKVSKGWDGLCRRVCSWGKFKDKSSKTIFWFFNLHMDHRGRTAQRESAKLIIEHIKQMCGATANVIITGDFNVKQGSEPYNTFINSGIVKDSYEAADIRFAPTGTFNGFNASNFTTHRIDHILVAESAKVERYGVLTYHYWYDQRGEEGGFANAPDDIKRETRQVKLPSDHYPVQAFIRFTKKK
jgi:endonuclease/exonuclease/phosphatase family metal-dependent hydrolase